MAEPIHPWVDTTTAPLYVIRFPPIPDDENSRTYIATWEAFVRSRRAPYAGVVDLSAVTTATALQRKMLADLDARLAPIEKRICAGAAYLAPSTVSQCLLTAFFWLAPPVYPHKIFTRMDESRAWVRECLSTFVVR